MTRTSFVVAVLLLTACSQSPVPESKTWTMAQLISGSKANKTFAGLPANQFAVASGQPIPWRSPPYEATSTIQEGPDALVVWPAFAEGKTAAFVAVEIWNQHPAPWVQPTYTFVNSFNPLGNLPLPNSSVVFPVDTTSTFDTPFWRVEWTTIPVGTPLDKYKSATSILDAELPLNWGAAVLCPIGPEGTEIAKLATDMKAVRPLSFEPIAMPTNRTAWVDGRAVSYLHFGSDRFWATADEQVIELPAYFFVPSRGDDVTPFQLPPVLPDTPAQWSLLRRYDVVLTGDLMVFVPASNPGLRMGLGIPDGNMPVTSAAIPDALAQKYALRIATKASCFNDPTTFPDGCSWLDSAGAVDDAKGLRAYKTDTLIAIAAVQEGP